MLVLGDNTPGFQKGLGTWWSSPARGEAITHAEIIGRIELPRVPFPPPTVVPFDPKIWDANPSTFYSAMSNVDVEIGAGNPAATGVRFRVAQHGFLSNMDFSWARVLPAFTRLATWSTTCISTAVATASSPRRPRRRGSSRSSIRPSTARGVRRSASTRRGLTLVNVTMRDMPVGIDIDRGYGDWLWGKDVRFENVRQAAVVISNENNVYTQIGFENATCRQHAGVRRVPRQRHIR